MPRRTYDSRIADGVAASVEFAPEFASPEEVKVLDVVLPAQATSAGIVEPEVPAPDEPQGAVIVTFGFKVWRSSSQPVTRWIY